MENGVVSRKILLTTEKIMQNGSESSFVPRMQDIVKICWNENNNCFMRKPAVCMCDNKRHRSAVLPSTVA